MVRIKAYGELKNGSGRETVRPFLRHKLCKQPPCLYEQAFPGQRTANGFAVSCLRYRGGQGKENSLCPINGDGGFNRIQKRYKYPV